MKTGFRFFLLIGVFVVACKKNNTTTTGIPLVTVDIIIYTNNPSYSGLNTVGGWQYISGGARGIIVYRYSVNEFKAYDRNCTYQSQNTCATVSMDSSNIIAVDSCCGSRFSIVDGSVIQGPASLHLQSYNTTYDGNTLHIYN